jgi:hypothetical protein
MNINQNLRLKLNIYNQLNKLVKLRMVSVKKLNNNKIFESYLHIYIVSFYLKCSNDNGLKVSKLNLFF